MLCNDITAKLTNHATVNCVGTIQHGGMSHLVSKTSNNFRSMHLQEMSSIYLTSVVICDRTDTRKHWFQGSTQPYRGFEWRYLEEPKELVMNVWETGPEMLKSPQKQVNTYYHKLTLT